MHTVRWIPDHPGDTYPYEVGVIDPYTEGNWYPVANFSDRRRAYQFCSWLNGGAEAKEMGAEP